MSENSKIEWTDHTFNPWEGCTKVSPGCLNCYAETRNSRWNGGTSPNWGKGAPRRRTSVKNWNEPLKWNKQAAFANAALLGEEIRPRVFCASLADWLDDEVPIEWLADLLQLIHKTPNLDWLLLTKRPENWRKRLEKVLAVFHDRQGTYDQDTRFWLEDWLEQIGITASPKNIWIGTTVEDQTRANQRVPQLLEIPAKVRFLSCEPLLDLVNLVPSGALGCNCPDQEQPDGTLEARCSGRCAFYRHSIDKMRRIDWVIVGGESGQDCRPFNPDWARSLRDQCKNASVAFFMKQMGGTRKPFAEIPDDLMIREFPETGGKND